MRKKAQTKCLFFHSFVNAHVLVCKYVKWKISGSNTCSTTKYNGKKIECLPLFIGSFTHTHTLPPYTHADTDRLTGTHVHTHGETDTLWHTQSHTHIRKHAYWHKLSLSLLHTHIHTHTHTHKTKEMECSLII